MCGIDPVGLVTLVVLCVVVARRQYTHSIRVYIYIYIYILSYALVRVLSSEWINYSHTHLSHQVCVEA